VSSWQAGARFFLPVASGFRMQLPQTGEDTVDDTIATGTHEGEGIFAAGANACKELVAHHGASAFVLAQLTAAREREPVPVADAGVVTEEQYAGSR
jgi:hypothetical protein